MGICDIQAVSSHLPLLIIHRAVLLELAESLSFRVSFQAELCYLIFSEALLVLCHLVLVYLKHVTPSLNKVS